MWSNENVALDLIDKKTTTYFYGIFAFILIGQLSDCNSEIQTCNSDFFFFKFFRSLHLTILTFSKLHDINMQFSLFSHNFEI